MKAKQEILNMIFFSQNLEIRKQDFHDPSGLNLKQVNDDSDDVNNDSDDVNNYSDDVNDDR
jgi:hypothetical protein